MNNLRKVLIVKLGAMGDVLRTTPILRELSCEVTWVTRKESLPLLSNNPYIARAIPPERCHEIDHINFDLVINVGDEIQAVDIVSKVTKRRLIGAYKDTGRIKYTEDASKWFDMGLVSRYGLMWANERKKLNKKSYQEFLFQMLDLDFKGQEYVLTWPKKQKSSRSKKTIGVEKRAGDRWSLKEWEKYDDLVDLLRKDGHSVKVFIERNSLSEYIDDINKCDLIIAGDTLCMHIGIALKKEVIAIFGPTSPDEIYSYGRVHKVIAPLDCIKCYKRKCDLNPNCMQSITLQTVYETANELIKEVKS